MTRVISIFLLLLYQFSCLLFSQQIAITELKTDYQINPLGFDNPVPEFSWQLQSDERNASQSAYELMISDDISKLAKGTSVIWKSNKILSSNTFGIKYAGKSLQSFTRYYWKVRVWNQNGGMSDWSKPAWFETSMLNQNDWKANWISDERELPTSDEDFYKETPNPLFRKDFTLKKGIKSARLYIAGLGYSIAYINGKRVGNNMLDMPWTQFAKQIQ